MADAPHRDGITLEGSRRMSTAARIDELRKKFEENPRRYFAPLANELRKAGDLVQGARLEVGEDLDAPRVARAIF